MRNPSRNMLIVRNTKAIGRHNDILVDKWNYVIPRARRMDLFALNNMCRALFQGIKTSQKTNSVVIVVGLCDSIYPRMESTQFPLVFLRFSWRSRFEKESSLIVGLSAVLVLIIAMDLVFNMVF